MISGCDVHLVRRASAASVRATTRTACVVAKAGARPGEAAQANRIELERRAQARLAKGQHPQARRSHIALPSPPAFIHPHPSPCSPPVPPLRSSVWLLGRQLRFLHGSRSARARPCSGRSRPRPPGSRSRRPTPSKRTSRLLVPPMLGSRPRTLTTARARPRSTRRARSSSSQKS